MAGPTLSPGLRQRQRIALTPALRQSLQILGLSATELSRLIASEVEQNPVLRLTGPTLPDSGRGFDAAANSVAQEDSVAEVLRRQIAELTHDRDLAAIASFLAADLTESGFLADSPEDLARLLRQPLASVVAAIEILQRCDPPGIGARDLADCLDLQLRRRGVKDSTRRLLIDNLPLFARRDWKVLAKKTGQPEGSLHEFAALLQELHPAPRALIEPGPPQYLFPDIRVTRRPQGGFDVDSLNPAETALSIDESLFARANESGETKAYLGQARERALALIRGLQSRRRTILRVAAEIVTEQHAFFANGPEYLRPMTRGALAARLGLHPSTVGRALAHKSLECDHGLFPFGFFFSHALPSRFGVALSSHVVQREIRRLIDAESPDDTLSDARIAEILRHSGVDIARRTVAKYRQCLKLPSSVQRRRSKTFL